jgi:hypothetical protein
LQIPDPEMRNRPAANRAAIHILDDALTTPTINTTEPQTLQARRLAKMFFLSPDVGGDGRSPRLRGRAMSLFDTILRQDAMPVEVFEGGTGALVICQEYTQQSGETYVRVVLPMSDAIALAEDILAVASRVYLSAGRC